MDPFEVRMQFLSQLSRLTSSLSSIHKLSHFALKHSFKCSHDIWDCLIEEAPSMSLNARINLLYFLDTLLNEDRERGVTGGVYEELVVRDLETLVGLVVPNSREGVLNLMSTNQVLKSWRTRRLLDVDLLDRILSDLENRKTTHHTTSPSPSPSSSFSRNDILRRIEDDRERHKRLRERIWVLPVPSTLLPTSTSSVPKPSPSPSSITPSSPSSSAPPPTTRGRTRGPQVPVEVEFEQGWENAVAQGSDWMGKMREDEKTVLREERRRCFAGEG